MRGNCSDQPRGGEARRAEARHGIECFARAMPGAELTGKGVELHNVAKAKSRHGMQSKGVERTARLSTVQQSKGSA